MLLDFIIRNKSLIFAGIAGVLTAIILSVRILGSNKRKSDDSGGDD